MLDRARVRQVFSEAAALPHGERAAFLDRACESEPELRAEVDSLLMAADREPRFLAAPTSGGSGVASDAMEEAIGPYKLLEQIGQGGFGVVYMAEQEAPIRRRVALKIIKVGMDTRAVIARFEAERQALAMMEHDHIARVFDAGATPSGRPYFVMELVRGEAITTYADRANLTIRERLELLVQVCQAIQHAHSKGVIHRDLKPGNILVATLDGRPHAKVIDFGIAKAIEHRLTERTLFTEFRQFVGTPEYMSPEQADGSLNIDTRTDVYSLGVLMYELLTGGTPFDPAKLRSAAYGEIQRMIREEEPQTPSLRLSRSAALARIASQRGSVPERLHTLVRGDLDWIVMKALDKERARRYDSASGLAADIARYLAGAPVDAAPPSRVYRIQKFVRRNPKLVGAGTLLACSLVLGLLGTSLGLIAARSSAERARSEGSRADAAAAESERRRAAAEYEGYIANVDSAYAALQSNDATRLRTRLDACPESLRNWEWKYLNAASDTSLMTLHHPRRSVQGMNFSHDGALLASTSGDGKVRVWDVASGSEVAALSAEVRFWGEVGFDPEDRCVYAAAIDGRMWFWNLATKQVRCVLTGHSAPVKRIYIVDEGTKALTASLDGSIRLWDLASADALYVRQCPVADSFAAALSPDEKSIAMVAGADEVEVRGVATGEILLRLAHPSGVNGVAWSPDGARLSTAGEDGIARIWDASDGRELTRFELASPSWIVRFSPDGTRVLSGESEQVRVWDAQTGRGLLVLKGHTHDVADAKFSKDGTLILTSGSDKTVRLWDASNGSPISICRGHTQIPWIVGFSPDGTRVVSGGDTTIRFWSTSRSRDDSLIEPQLADSSSVRMSPDGKWLVELGSQRVRLIDVATGAVSDIFNRTDLYLNFVSGVFTPDSARVLCAFRDNTVDVWDIAAGRTVLTLRAHDTGQINALALRRDGTRILTGSTDGTATIWDATTGAEILTLRGHDASVNSAAYDPSGTRIVTTSNDRTVRIWDAATGQLLQTLVGHDNAVADACFSSDASRILSTSWDSTARVWDASTGAQLVVLQGHENVVLGGEFSHDMTRIVTHSFDGTARLWDTHSGREVLSIGSGVGGMHTASFTPDGSKLLLGNTSGRAWLLDSVPMRERASPTAPRVGPR